MPEASRERPARHTVLHTFTAFVRARPDAVFTAVSARVEPGAATAVAYLSDPEARLIVTQGGWWYRGEYRVIGDDAGSMLEHVVMNVAQRGEKAALVAGRKAILDAPLQFHDLVKSLRAELEPPS